MIESEKKLPSENCRIKRLGNFEFRIYRPRNYGFPVDHDFRKRQHVGTEQTLSANVFV